MTTSLDVRKKSPAQLQKEKDIQSAKTMSLDSLFIEEGKIKMELRKLDEERKSTLHKFGRTESSLRQRLSKTKRMINYKREALQK